MLAGHQEPGMCWAGAGAAGLWTPNPRPNLHGPERPREAVGVSTP